MYPLSTSTLTVPRNPERRLQLPRWSKWYPWTSKSPSYRKWKGFQANENNPHLTIHMSPPSTCSHLSQKSIGYKSILSGMGFPQGLFHVPAPPPTKIKTSDFSGMVFSPGFSTVFDLKDWLQRFLLLKPCLVSWKTSKAFCHCEALVQALLTLLIVTAVAWFIGEKIAGKFMVDST